MPASGETADPRGTGGGGAAGGSAARAVTREGSPEGCARPTRGIGESPWSTTASTGAAASGGLVPCRGAAGGGSAGRSTDGGNAGSGRGIAGCCSTFVHASLARTSRSVARPVTTRSYAAAARSSPTSPSSRPRAARPGSFASGPSALALKLCPLGTCTNRSPETLSVDPATFGTTRTPSSCSSRANCTSVLGLLDHALSSADQTSLRGSSFGSRPCRVAAITSFEEADFLGFGSSGPRGSPGRSP